MLVETRPMNYIRAVKGLVSILRDPNDTAQIFEITRALQATQSFQQMLTSVRATEAGERLMADRYLGPQVDVDALLALPEGSLGHAYARFLRDQGLDAVFYPQLDVTDEMTWLAMRLPQTHDIWHVITGFGTTPTEELGLQAFMLAQLRSPLAAALIGALLLKSVLRPLDEAWTLEEAMDRVTTGWRLGRAAGPLIAQRWELGWDRPVADWRRELGVAEA